MIPDVNLLGLQAGERADAKVIAGKMQTMFMEMLIKSMEDSVEAESGLFGKSASSEIYRGMLREHLAVAVSSQLESPLQQQLEGKLQEEMPVAGVVSSPMGWRRDPIDGTMRYHKGTDIAAPYGSNVKAVAGGVVIESGEKGGYGNTVVIQAEDGRRMLYAHNHANLVRPGDKVEAGQVIAQVGASGRATGPHVHFEVLE